MEMLLNVRTPITPTEFISKSKLFHEDSNIPVLCIHPVKCEGWYFTYMWRTHV